MRWSSVAVLLGMSALLAPAGEGGADDPFIEGHKLSELVKRFKAARTADERSGLAIAIGRGKDKAKSAVPVLAAALKDRESIVRLNVANALGSMGPAASAAIPGLVATLKDRDDSVREAAARSLGLIGPGAKGAAPALAGILKDASQPAQFRAAAARALGGIGPEAKAAVPLLRGTLKDGNARLRVAAAIGLYRIDKGNAKAALKVLRESLKGKDDFAKTEAVFAVGGMGPDAAEAIPDLIAVLARPSMAAYYARELLGKMPGAVPALVAALKGPDERLREAAASVLKEYYPEAAKKAGLKK
jgi:HEAT repeat protein